MEKVILIICDGLGDRPVRELDNKTPLEAASTPHLDALAKKGVTGLMHTIGVGIRPGSDVSHMAIFGYDPEKYYTGRGPFEAAGYELDLKPGDVALRGNFGTVDENFKILDRRAQRIDNTQELADALNGIIIDKTSFTVKSGVGHRAAVVLKGVDLDGRITDVDPHVPLVKIHSAEAKADDRKAKRTADIVNEFVRKTYEILHGHPLNQQRIKENLPPANILLVRGAGSLPHLPEFTDKYRMRAVCIAGAGLYKGIARLTGMDIAKVEGATGKPDTDVRAKVNKAIELLKEYDFVFLHIKGTDVLAEDGNFFGKMKFIEKIDKGILPLLHLNNTLLAVTADHSTACFLKQHTADPVPVLISADHIRTDDVRQFSEKAVASGALGHIKGLELMLIIKDFIGEAPLYGA